MPLNPTAQVYARVRTIDEVTLEAPRLRSRQAFGPLNGGAISGPQSQKTRRERQVPQDPRLTKRDRNDLHNMSKAARASS